ncbi:MAG TPA: serine/threonine-protein kinase [Rhodocyclaceae bacterium]|nr:serine/threonine-protein kinase [Rhodocyclaceae bacterium]
MPSFANAIRTFQNGGLSHNEFLAQIDRVLANDQGNSARLLEILKEEHTNFPLPPDVYEEVQRRIEHRGDTRADGADDETRVQTSPVPAIPRPHPPPAPEREAPGSDPERIKGVGDTLNGRFVLEECLGFGGMGMVYKALDLRKLEASDRNPYIAIKVLNVQFRGHPKSLIALQREAKKAQKLAHPNIVTVYDFDRDGSMVYLTMEYLAGKPLSQLLRSPDFKGMPWPSALRIVAGIAKALGYAHERGFVHCDLKPANVFVTDSGEVKVIDFGIARVFQKPEQDTEATVFDPGSLGGLTPAYASPEMIEHLEPDPRDDIYALACITYELLTGRHPFDRVPANQARSAHMKPLRPKGLGLRQWRALRNALCFEREGRTPTVARFLQDISGESRTLTYVGLMGSSLVLAAIFSAGLVYYWNFRAGHGSGQAAPEAAPEAPPAAAEAPAAPSLAAVAPVLARVPCAALLPALEGNALAVRGYLSKSFGAARLKEMLGAVPGIASVRVDAQPVRDEECPVVEAFAPYWSANQQAGRATSIQTKAPRGELAEGDPLVVNITTPGYDSYVSIDYYVLDGSVVHLVPSPRARDNQAPPNYSATIGSLGNWVISKPFGTELIVLVATPVPLFDRLRPEDEPRADYLKAVAERLSQIAGKHGRDKITADFVEITTRARKP